MSGPNAPPPASSARLESVDLLRGLVMVLMALDHTRDFFTNVAFDPLDLQKTHPALFLTRWITHFCAPVFVFLAGTGAFLSTTRGKTTRELSWFLLTRGLWLVLLENTVVHCLGWNLCFDFHSLQFLVIWAIGWSMVTLAALVWLPAWAVAVFGLAMIAGHNALDGLQPESWGAWGWLWRILHAGGEINIAPGWRAGAGYPLIPWIGVMAAGFAFGTVLQRAPAARRRWMAVAGVLCVAFFVALRFSKLYGDPAPWSSQKNFVFTLFSFLHCWKYPPSLCYLLMTLGPALLFLAALDGGTPRFLQPVLVFGRAPLFFYLLHLPFIHLLAVEVNLIRFGRADWLYGVPPGPGQPPVPLPLEQGFDLPGVYLAWVLVVAGLYPACHWFAELKRRRREAWLSYL